jgi:hypothetical protein
VERQDICGSGQRDVPERPPQQTASKTLEEAPTQSPGPLTHPLPLRCHLPN